MTVDFKQSRHWLFVAGASGAAALLIACGGSGGDAPTTPQTSPATTLAAALPDGQQLVVMRSLDLNGHSAVVDPVELLTGDAAQTACMADHADEPELCELDYYYSNTAQESISVPVAADATFVAATSDSLDGAQAPGPEGWVQDGTGWICEADVEAGCPTSAENFAKLQAGDQMIVNITVEGGSITTVVHQYTP